LKLIRLGQQDKNKIRIKPKLKSSHQSGLHYGKKSRRLIIEESLRVQRPEVRAGRRDSAPFFRSKVGKTKSTVKGFVGLARCNGVSGRRR